MRALTVHPEGTHMQIRLKSGLVVLGVAATLALAGCGSSTAVSTPTDSPSTSTNTLADLVPADIAADGKLTFGTDSTYPPNEYMGTDGKTLEGMSIDLGNAIAAKLGLTAEYVASPFDAIIPAVKSGKYEAGISSFTINAERMKVVDFVSYYVAGTAWAGPTGSTLDPNNACGLAIAVQKGTVQVDDLNTRSKACTDAGKKAITVNQYQSQQDAAASVVSGKNAGMLADSDPVRYAVLQSGGKLVTIGEQYDTYPYGIALKKDNGTMAEALQKAIQAIIDDGTYTTILEKWAATAGAITTSEVNPAV
jgi:polar amino acid transport system substrate-binding protein